METSENTIYVLGAGFTKAFFPNAPLMVDDYDSLGMAEKFRNFPHASRILNWERNREPSGNINIERLMTRLDGLMPYDFDHDANEELGMLLSEVKKRFMGRLKSAREGQSFTDDLATFARHCIENRATCITFNYDDLLDEALWSYNPSDVTPSWHPDGGYGFFCKPSVEVIQNTSLVMDETSMLLLKLHGSVNWLPRRGYPRPLVVDAITHHEAWLPSSLPDWLSPEILALHLESEPFIVPPVLFKSSLVEQPILRLIWHRAYQALASAHKVIFIGYSFPVTDIAAAILFDESLKDLPRSDVQVINFANSQDQQRQIREAYTEILGHIPEENFYFDGALTWTQGLGTRVQENQ